MPGRVLCLDGVMNGGGFDERFLFRGGLSRIRLLTCKKSIGYR